MQTNIIMNGDCLLHLKELPENSVDAIITDPPYGLSFMNKHWDYDVPSVEIWKECLRVLKHGGHLLSFAGTRTYHRMTINIEDAGFEIRDMISWIYGSGFPKSLNIGKQIDKIQGNERVKGELKFKGGTQLGIINDDNWKPKDVYDDKGNSEWEGWETALKPACEPIVVARKPLSEKNVALNVLKWGTGGINIDECRIETNPNVDDMLRKVSREQRESETWKEGSGFKNEDNSLTGVRSDGRFPANIILDEESGKMLDEQSRESKSPQSYVRNANGFNQDIYGSGMGEKEGTLSLNFGDVGGASRFFYCAKASKGERNLGLEELPYAIRSGKVMHNANNTSDKPSKGFERFEPEPMKNNHPTVKPLKLMEYLVKLITKENQIVLDPFLGSGTTAIACIKLNRLWIGIEREPEYIKIAQARIKHYSSQNKLDVFDELNEKEKKNVKQ